MTKKKPISEAVSLMGQRSQEAHTSLQEQVRILVADVDRLTARIAEITRQADGEGLPIPTGRKR